jgi:polyphosphate kinase
LAPQDVESPQLYFNRELSWLEFNQRVLEQALCPDLPPLERLKFLAIVSSNLDEFFQVRVAGLMQQRGVRVRRRDVAGMTPGEQLAAIARRAHQMVAEHSEALRHVLEELGNHGLAVFEAQDWTTQQRRFLRSYFTKEILPVVTPLAMEALEPAPVLPGLRLHVAAVLAPGQTAAAVEGIVVVPVPTEFPRLVSMPAEGGLHLARLEDVIAENLAEIFPGGKVLATAVFRVTRDADVAVQDDDAGDLLQAVEEAVLARRRRAAVRLEISAGPNPRIKKWLVGQLGIRPEDVYEVAGMLDATALAELLARPGFEALKVADWPPQPPRDLIGPSVAEGSSPGRPCKTTT